mmetsp:Transcript_16909/g.35257  ORF Transcript_16909/g.35257 Transcript_16909/m.35257 type:complete len:115 (-) Transcript_16909:493-837(-)
MEVWRRKPNSWRVMEIDVLISVGVWMFIKTPWLLGRIKMRLPGINLERLTCLSDMQMTVTIMVLFGGRKSNCYPFVAEADRFGERVGIYENTVVVGATHDGSVYAFARDERSGI